MTAGRPGVLVLLALAVSLGDRARALHHDAQRTETYSHLGASVVTLADSGVQPADAKISKKYLIASFPSLRQVAYVHLPDNVWRPLIIGEVASPKGIAVDAQNARLFVADPPSNVIWWYALSVDRNGLLQTTGDRHAAVEGYSALWVSCSGVGDLYFTGRKRGSPASTYDSVFKQEVLKIAALDSLNPTEVYTRSNTGAPNSMAWMPSGIAVDSFFVYWGNQEKGQQYGSVVKGSRTNVRTTPSDMSLLKMNDALAEVRGMCATGTHLFYLSKSGVYGTLKSTPATVSDPNSGLIATAPVGTSSASWNPANVAWDGEHTLYFTDAANGVVYSLPSLNSMPHNLTKFADAPGSYGIALIGFQFTQHSGSSRSSMGLLLAAALAAAASAIHLR